MNSPYLIFLSLFLCFFFAYYPIIYDLRDSVLGNELAHHAPLVIALSGFLVYLKRRVLLEHLAANETSLKREKATCLILGLCINGLGQAAGVYYLAQLSIPLTLYGMARFLAGREFARQLVFPLLFMLLAFPIPGKVYMTLVFPLKLLVTQAAGILLSLMGYPVRIYGNIIEVSSVLMGVVDACSGLNSLMAIVTLAIFYGHLVIRRWDFRLAVVVAMLPVIMAANILRVASTAIIAVKWGSDIAEGKLHSLWGIMVFVVAVIGLIGITKMFIAIENRRQNA